MAAEHPCLAAARAGAISRYAVLRYLESLRYLLLHSQMYLQRAESGARSRGLNDLASFFEKKVAEEAGHDKWAEEDLSNLGGGPAELEPLPAMRELVLYLDDLIRREPRLFAVYTTIAEYMTVLAGPIWVRALNEGCGVPLDSLTALTKHIEADQHHAAEAFRVLDVLITDESLESDVRRTIDDTMCLFSKVYDQVASA